MDPKFGLCFELLFSMIYIESKRDPEKMTMVWFIVVKSKYCFIYLFLDAYLPFVLLGFSVVTGGDIVGDIVGIAAGHLYYYIKDLAPINHQLDILKTPQFL